MERFTQLYLALDRSNRTSDKLEAIRSYFHSAPPEDAIWAVYLFTVRKIGRTITSRQMRTWASEVSGFAPWMLNECYSVVGDLSETLSLLIPFENPTHPAPPLHEIVEQRLKVIGKLSPDKQRDMLIQTWRDLTVDQRFIFHKLISGNFRVGVSRQSLTIALAEVAGVETSVMAHRLSGHWSPQTMTMQRLLAPVSEDEPRDANLPYPFMLAHALGDPPESLGAFTDWQHEWKWDGIRAQIIRRQNKTAIWSRGDELISSGFPELVQTGNILPDGDTVLDRRNQWPGTKLLLARPSPSPPFKPASIAKMSSPASGPMSPSCSSLSTSSNSTTATRETIAPLPLRERRNTCWRKSPPPD